uniref:Porin family protein n=1 Tax=Eiseniibacteriota bacterium TaxID=2212470 RepID=A0A832MLY7_UNCEI
MRVRKLAVIAPLLLASVVCLGADARHASAQAAGGAALSDTAKARGRARRERGAPSERTAWMVGAGGGYGVVDPRLNFYKPGAEAGGTIQWRVGYAASPRTVVGIESTQWSAKPDTIRWLFSAVAPTVTWYSKGRANNANQMFVRLGAGWGHAEAGAGRVVGRTVAGEDSVVTERINDDGFSLLGALGYEWRFGRRYAIAPQLGVTFINLSRGYNSLWGEASLQINRYW